MSRSPLIRILIVDVVLIVIFTLLSEDFSFFSAQNARNVAIDATQITLLALGLALLLGAGEFDLSLGANLVLASVLGARVIAELDGNVALACWTGLAVCLATGAAIGAINGIVIAHWRVNSLIATLGMLGIAQGAALLISGGSDIGGLPIALQEHFGLAQVAGVPLPALVALACAAAAGAGLRYLRFGTHTLALGSSRLAAERSGLPVRRHLIALFTLAGLLCGLAAFVDLARFTATAVSGHQLDALTAITAVAIGGSALAGGRVTITGTVLGAILTVLLQLGLIVVGLSAFWQLVAVGAALILAVVAQRA